MSSIQDGLMSTGFNEQYIEDLDTEKLKELYLRASYILSLSLCQSVSRTHARLGSLSSFLELMERELANTNFSTLTLDDQIKLYNVISNSSTRVFDSILKLNTSMATNIDAVSKIEEGKEKYKNANHLNKKDPTVQSMLSSVQKEIEKRKAGKINSED